MKLAELAITNQCNYTCDYCKSEASHLKDRFRKGWDFAGPIVDFAPWLLFVKLHLKDYIIQVTGGEPLLVQGIVGFVNELAKTNRVVINTNGTTLAEKFSQFDPGVKFRVSYHPEFLQHNFAETVSKIPRERLLVNYVAHPRHILAYKNWEHVETLQELGVDYEVTAFEGAYNGNYFRCFNEIYEGITTDRLPMDSDFELVVIQPTGLVFDCHGTMNPIGSIHSGVVDLSSCKKRCMIPDGSSLCPMFDNVKRIFKS
jgi:hypothetical protein